MAREYLNVGNINDDLQDKVKQSLKFKTGKFIWKVKFNIPLDPESVNNQNLFVLNETGTILKSNIFYNKHTNEIEIEPTESYTDDMQYVLYITTKVTSVKGSPLKEAVHVPFHIR